MIVHRKAVLADTGIEFKFRSIPSLRMILYLFISSSIVPS